MRRPQTGLGLQEPPASPQLPVSGLCGQRERARAGKPVDSPRSPGSAAGKEAAEGQVAGGVSGAKPPFLPHAAPSPVSGGRPRKGLKRNRSWPGPAAPNGFLGCHFVAGIPLSRGLPGKKVKLLTLCTSQNDFIRLSQWIDGFVGFRKTEVLS